MYSWLGEKDQKTTYLLAMLLHMIEDHVTSNYSPTHTTQWSESKTEGKHGNMWVLTLCNSTSLKGRASHKDSRG